MINELPTSATREEIIAAFNKMAGIVNQMADQYATGTITDKGLEIGYKDQTFLVKKEGKDVADPITGGIVSPPPIVIPPVKESPYTSIPDLSKAMVAERTNATLRIDISAGASFSLSLRGNSKRDQYDKYLTFQKTAGKKLFVKSEKAPQKRVEESVDTSTGFSAYLTFNESHIIASTGAEELLKIERPKGIDIIFKDLALSKGVVVDGKGVQEWR